MSGRGRQEDGGTPLGGSTSGFTRRQLLRGAGIAAAAGTVLGSAIDALAGDEKPEVRVQGPAAVKIKLKVNGTEREVAVEPRETLLDVLRVPLDTTGPKPACDRGSCGACTVHLDGKPVYACTILAVDADGHAITTAEGLVSAEGRAILDAFVARDAMQCGFCTPGMVMSCAAAVAEHGSSLTVEQARAACAGNLCRCGTYPHVLEAALAAAKASTPAKGR